MMDSWKEYWAIFDVLCSSLEQRGETDTVQSLRKCQRYVNGLTDGWWDFLDHFRATVRVAEKFLLPTERDLVAT
jgi:hypothetical protein